MPSSKNPNRPSGQSMAWLAMASAVPLFTQSAATEVWLDLAVGMAGALLLLGLAKVSFTELQDSD